MCAQVTTSRGTRLRETVAIALGTLIITLITFPLLAAGLLALYPFVQHALRKLPPHEYVQIPRAPAWFAVAIGGGMFLLSALALRHLPPGGEQFFIGWSREGAVLVVDAYGLWGSMLMGAMLAVAAWVPAARRSLVPGAAVPFLVVLLLAWLAMVALFSERIGGLLGCWLLLVGGAAGLWALLFRRRRWPQTEPVLVLALCAVLGTIGLLWLNRLAHGAELTGIWSALISVSPRLTNSAMLLIILGWFLPAAYLPWWLWNRREEEAAVWLPAALMVAAMGVFSLVRLLFLAFPASELDALPLSGLDHSLFIRRMLGWLLSWGMIGLLAGAGGLAYLAIQRMDNRVALLRPLMLVAAGLLALGIVGAMAAPNGRSIAGLLWLQCAWAGAITIWLAVGQLLPVLTRAEQAERGTLIASAWVALAVLVAVPPTPGFFGLLHLWKPLQQFGAPRPLIVLTLVAAAGSAGTLLPRWAKGQSCEASRPGVGWGILGPFLLAMLLLAASLLSGRMAPLFEVIRQSLLQAY